MTNEQIIKEKKRGDYWKNEYKVLRDYNIYEKKSILKVQKIFTMFMSEFKNVNLCGVN